MSFKNTLKHLTIFIGVALTSGPLLRGAESSEALPDVVSYYQHVRPIFQQKCHGCHQPARSKAEYIMTTVESLKAGGEGGEAVVIPGKPEESYLIDVVTLQKGDERPEMPEKDEPLTPYELSLVTQWIKDGARDDTPENARQRYNADNPPQYAVPPVITSLDFSPDGKLLAVAGFHEVLIHHADGSGLVSRLVGLSERIESARFSPNGKLLAVAGGLPGRMGEIQVWDVEKASLKFSKPVGHDTAYGASWSPDGKFIAYGLPDNTVHAFEIEEGEEILFMGGHNDWVLDTAWSVKGDHLVSVSRDMSAKLTEIKTERFIDNITSITPGALKGGMNAIDRHPFRDHILVGGSDGIPQIYRMHRETERKIGDNANLIRKYPPMKGRIWSAAFAPDGKTFAAVSSLNGEGQVNLYQSDYDATISPELKELLETARRNPDGSKNIDSKIEEFLTRGAILLHSLDFDSPVFSVAYAPDGSTVAAGSSDGRVLLINAATGALTQTLIPVEITDAALLAKAKPIQPDQPVNFKKGKVSAGKNEIPEGAKVVSLSISPSTIQLNSPHAYNQLLVAGKLNTGDTIDLTRQVEWKLSRTVATVDKRGVIRPDSVGRATLTASFQGKKVEANVAVTGFETTYHPDFLVDVNPVLTRLGCNSGTCHGAKDGKAGFKLSLRGYDNLHDVRAFSDDHAARRLNFASPDDSLMLLKATGAVPHEGGMVTDIGSDYYRTIRQWITDGARLNPEAKKVSRIELLPHNPVIQSVWSSQQVRVVAHYPDGSQRDVTLESFIEIGNMEVASADDFGLVTTIRRGEAPILARYEGAYQATTLTVMGDRSGFVWEQPDAWGKIDELVSAKWKRLKIQPSSLTSDTEFVRRIYLDLTGLPPTPEALTQFINDRRPTREKRSDLIDALIGSPSFVDHWSNKWADMLQVNSKFLGTDGAKLFRDWIRDQVADNKPYDEFVYSILTASGSNKENPAASYYKILRTPEDLVENTTHLFLATRFNCNKCHDHPFEKWNVDNYYQTAAFFSQISLERDTENAGDKNIGGSAVENAQPLYEIISDDGEGSVTNIVTGQIAKPVFPYAATVPSRVDKAEMQASRRESLAAWITAEDNQFFAKSYANRIWGYLTGTGIIEPIDDIRAGNPPTNPELLDYLTRQFVDSGFNVRELMREICNSRTYQLSIETNPFNEDDDINYSHAKARRLPAEVLFDAVYSVTGSTPNIPGAKPGMRAAQLADAQLDTKSGFLASLGRPSRESACECDRSNDVQLGAVMSLLSGPAIADAVGDPTNDIAKLVNEEPDDDLLAEKLYLRVLNRKPTLSEIALVKRNWSLIDQDHQTLLKRLADMESEWVYKKSVLETERFRKVAKARGEINAYMPEYKQKQATAKKAKNEWIKSAELALNAFEEKDLPLLEKAVLKSITDERAQTRWTALKPEKVDAGNKIQVTINEDASLLATGEAINSVEYSITIPLKSQTLTGLMLEALTDDSLDSFGPGLRESGDFVVSEFSADFSTSADPKPKDIKKLRFEAAEADYVAEGYDVQNLINGDKERNDKAWSVAGQGRRPHWARMKLEKPLIIGETGGYLMITVVCRYSDGDWPLSKFRIHATDSVNPLSMGLPVEIAAIVTKPPQDIDETETAMLRNWIKYQDVQYLDQQYDWVKAKRPLPSDKEMNGLKAALAMVEKPVQDDPVLVQLRSDVQFSSQQAANSRLTAAQDLAWALINNSAFIFNH